MHPQRWGDAAHAGPLPESTQGLVEFAFGASNTPAVDSVTIPASGLTAELIASLEDVVGADNVLIDDESRRLRTRGKSTTGRKRRGAQTAAKKTASTPKEVSGPATSKPRKETIGKPRGTN